VQTSTTDRGGGIGWNAHGLYARARAFIRAGRHVACPGVDGDDRGVKGDDWRYWLGPRLPAAPGMGCGFTTLLVVFILATLGVVSGAWTAGLLVVGSVASWVVEFTWRWLRRNDPR
jgi:hypothetical protein